MIAAMQTIALLGCIALACWCVVLLSPADPGADE